MALNKQKSQTNSLWKQSKTFSIHFKFLFDRADSTPAHKFKCYEFHVYFIMQ